MSGPGLAQDLSRVQRILIRGTNWVGDAVMTLPALEAVGRTFPWAKVMVLARPWVERIYASHPAVHGVLLYPDAGGALPRIQAFFDCVLGIRRGRFDLAILFQNAFEAALLAFLARVPLRAGYATDGRGLLLTHPVRRSEEILGVHQVDYYLGLLRSLGLEAPPGLPMLRGEPGARDRAEGCLTTLGVVPGELLVGLAPGAVYGSAKRWPPARFAAVGRKARDCWGAKVLVFGSPGEAPICGAVAEGVGEGAFSLAGRTDLGLALGLMGRCSLFVSNDSGLMHAAAALEVPTLGIFGSTNPVTTGPMGRKTLIVRGEAACAPCLKETCPEDFRCMLSIGTDRVWEGMERLRGGLGDAETR